MNDNIFSSLSRYNSAADENYLTEALVFVTKLLLERNPTKGLELLNLLCCQREGALFGNPDSVLISTQVTTGAGTPDIEVRDENTLVFIEVKHDSPLGPNQLERYSGQLVESGVPSTRLVLLARSRLSIVETTLQPSDYSRVYWYEIHNWLSEVDAEDEVAQYLVEGLKDFLEEKRMSLKKVSWEYMQGVPALLNLTNMLESVIAEVMPGVKVTRTAGWNWRGFYLPGKYWVGVRYDQPLVISFEDNQGYNPVTYKCELDLEKEYFFSLSKEEQFECLGEFLRRANEGIVEPGQDAK